MSLNFLGTVRLVILLAGCFVLPCCASPGVACDLFEVRLLDTARNSRYRSLTIDTDGRAEMNAKRDFVGGRIERSWVVSQEDLLVLRQAVARERFYELPKDVGTIQGFCAPLRHLIIKECAASNSVWLGEPSEDEESRRALVIWGMVRALMDAKMLADVES